MKYFGKDLITEMKRTQAVQIKGSFKQMKKYTMFIKIRGINSAETWIRFTLTEKVLNASKFPADLEPSVSLPAKKSVKMPASQTGASVWLLALAPGSSSHKYRPWEA